MTEDDVSIFEVQIRAASFLAAQRRNLQNAGDLPIPMRTLGGAGRIAALRGADRAPVCLR